MSDHQQRAGFTFKQFHVAHEGCAMKVGTDAVLLGAWVSVTRVSRILDIGSGSGILSLMLAQRTDGKLHIDALDIDADAVAQARENIRQSPWPEAIHDKQCPLQEYEAEPYDLLISNPPYFQPGQTLGSPARQWARHSLHLPHDQLLTHAARLSHADSALALVLPTDAGEAITASGPATGWHLHSCCTVYPTPTKPAVRQLLVFHRKAPHKILRSELTIRQHDGAYSPAFTRLCQTFYLKM